MKKFPQVIHVTVEGEDDSQYFQVNESGVSYLDVPDQSVAIYKLVEVGSVKIVKSFAPKAKKSRKAS